jgi:O-methyltransferase domain/Dimerisation domain
MSSSVITKPAPAAPAGAPQPQPADLLMQVATGYMASRALNLATELKIADLLSGGPKPVAELAKSSGANEDALYRILRALASVGIFTEVAPRKFGLTPAAELLQSGIPGSFHPMVRFMCDAFHFTMYAEMMHALKTGETVCDRVLGMPIFEYFAKDSQEGAVFHDAMTSFSSAVIPAVLEVYDFSSIGTLMDVAGGHGFVLTSVLEKYPQMKGVLFEMEHVCEGAQARIAKLECQGRCQVVTGDFFKSIPGGADAIIMKHIIHDWNDEQALTILKNCHQALAGRSKAKVILLEAVLPHGNEPHFGKIIDLEMLMMPGGRERTEEEFRTLFAKAGFQLTRIVPNKSPLSVVEAERI